MTIPASTVTGGHASDGEIVDNQAAINALCSVFHFDGTSVNVLHGNASGDPTYSAVSLTADVSGVLPIANGGTGGTVAAVNGAVVYSTATAYAMTAAGTSGQLLQSAGAASPVWAGEVAWTGPTLLNSYTSVRTPGYLKDAAGFVHLRGTVTGGTADTIATLPVGYRPSQGMFIPSDHNGAYGRINIDTSGNILSDVGGHTNVVLDGITFDTR